MLAACRSVLLLTRGCCCYCCRHVVLVVHHVSSQRWGALGISRREELAYKELVFDSLSDLLADYKAG